MALTLATYNVKNLFEPRSDGEIAIVDEKIMAIAQTVTASGADVVGLQEIGSALLARRLSALLAPIGFHAAVVGTADDRGIRCALLSRLPIRFARIHTSDSLDFPRFQVDDPRPFGARIPLRRGIVHVGIDVPPFGLISVLVVHFKSPLPAPLRDASGARLPIVTAHDRSEAFVRSWVWRAAEALFVRKLVDAALANEKAPDGSASVAVVGDLNDGPESPIVHALRSDGPGALFDCTSAAASDLRYSIIHGGRRTQVDHILTTQPLATRVTRAAFDNARLRDHGPFESGADEPVTVDSDHALVAVRFD